MSAGAPNGIPVGSVIYAAYPGAVFVQQAAAQFSGSSNCIILGAYGAGHLCKHLLHECHRSRPIGRRRLRKPVSPGRLDVWEIRCCTSCRHRCHELL